jgi:hypothetical protein
MAGAALIVEFVFSTRGLVLPQYDAAASKSNLRWLRVRDLSHHRLFWTVARPDLPV